MGNNIDIDLFTQKSEITTSTPDITIEITGLVQLNSFIGLDDTPTYYENGKFFKVEDNKIVYTDINWGDIKGKIEDNPELKAEVDRLVEQEAKHYTGEIVSEAITAHDNDVNAHQSIQLTIQDNYTTLDNKIELNKIDSDAKFDQTNKRIDNNTEYITRVDNYSQEINKKLEDLTLEVDVDIKGNINQLREDLTSTNQTVQDKYTALNMKIDNTKSDLSDDITALETKVDNNYITLDTKIGNTKTELDTKIDTTKAELIKDVSDKYTALNTRISANTKDITDLTQTVQDDYKEINSHITDLYNKKVDKVEGKELSTNDFTNELKTKLENIETTAQVNIIESISVDGVQQTIDDNKNVNLHQPVYTLVEKDTPADTNIKEYNLTIDGTTTGVTIEIPKDIYIEKCTLKYSTVVDEPYTGAKVNDAYLQFDRANDTPIYTPIPELQIHAGQDITVDENNVISTVIPIPRKISELNNDNYTVTDENYVHTDNNFTDGYIGRIEDLEKTTVKNVEYNKTTQKITVTFGDKTTKILTLEELLTGASYDGETGNFTFTKANGEPVVVNTPKENFLSDVQYDGTTKVITFTMSSGATFEVNVSNLIDVYTVKSTNSVEMSIENGNEISSNVKVSATDGNIISVKTDGVYAKHQDISHLATKDEVNTGLATKVDTTMFTNELAKKADKTDVETELAKKVDTTTYTTGLATKVDKVEGKSLIEDTEIERLKTLKNYDDTQIKTAITDINSVLETKASTTDLENGLKTKQDKLTFDTTPTANSTKPVTSGGIKTELDKKVNSTTLTAELAKKQNKLTAGTGIKIEGDIISNTQTSAEWGNIQGDITAQKDLQNALNTKASTTSVTTLEDEVTDLSGRVTANEADIILKANKTDLPTVATTSKTGLVKPDGKTIKVKDDGTISSNAGVDLGTILCIPFGVDENENKYRYLNGQTIVQSQYPAFTAKVKSWQSTRASLFTTETEWQAIKTASKLGQCGKFVIDDEAGTIRLPAIININGLTDLSKAGLIKDESLPDHKHTRGTMEITGGLGTVHQYGYYENGAFYRSWTGTKGGSGGGNGDWSNWEFKASRNWTGSTSAPDNATYQDGAPVQQEAVQYPYVICVNTGVEEAERPINNYQVNNTDSYGDNKYVGNTILNNLSWLRSTGQENSGTIYTGFYNWAVANIGQPFGAGYIKENSATDITDYDLVINQANQTFILPTLNGEEVLPSDKYENLTLGASSEKHIAPANGWIVLNKIAKTSPKYVNAYTGSNGRMVEMMSSFDGQQVKYSFFMRKGEKYIVDYNADGDTLLYRFVYAKGNGNLYYYVGDTLQNADLINIARMQEQITDINAQSRGYLVESYTNGTSGYRLYSDGYCEQWGYSDTDSNNLRTITFLKPYKDTNYVVTLGASNINDPQNYNSRMAKIWSITTTNMVVVGIYENGILYDFHFYWRICGYIA